MIEIDLNLSEVALVFQVGMRRQLESLARGLHDRHGARNDGAANGLAKHVEGAGGELAFAKATDHYWAGDVNAGKAGDVGLIQVRTRSRSGWDLIVRSDDGDRHAFVLVVGQLPRYSVVGWIWGAAAKQDRFLKNHGGHGFAYFVPQAELNPVQLKEKDGIRQTA